MALPAYCWQSSLPARGAASEAVLMTAVLNLTLSWTD